jgi:hypothetical protein
VRRQFDAAPLPIPGQQLIYPVDGVAHGHAVDDVGEISLGIEAIEFGAFDQRVYDRCTLAALVGTEKQEVLSRHGDAAQQPFGEVVIDAETAVRCIAGQRIPARHGILQRLAEGAFGR